MEQNPEKTKLSATSPTSPNFMPEVYRTVASISQLEKAATYGDQIEPEVAMFYRTMTTKSNFERKPTFNDEEKPTETDVHLMAVDNLLVKYSTDPNLGLSAAAVSRKAANGKRNKLSPPKTNYFQKFISYTFGGFNLLMWIACILSFLSYQPLGGSDPDVLPLGVGVLLLIVIAVSTFFYAYVDWNASKIMRSIQGLVAQKALVLRDGKEELIDSHNLVVGDIVLLSIGQRVPADIRLIEVSSDLQFDRSLLTGESNYVAGTVESTDKNHLETKNLALSSTFVVRGKGKGVVYSIGDDTVIGEILKMSGKKKTPPTPIQKEINSFVLTISILAITFFCLAIILYFSWIKVQYPTFETVSVAIINAIGCLTAFTPIGLPVSFALALTIIARRMAARRVLVKNLSTIETLGCMSVLCSDKTGTLTMGKMFVQFTVFLDSFIPVAEPGSDQDVESSKNVAALKDLHMIASLCNDAKFLPGNENDPVFKRPVNGDSTDAAILCYAEQYRTLFPSLDGYATIFTMAFNSKNKFMAKIVRKGGEAPLLLIKGAPDILMPACSSGYMCDGTMVELKDARLDNALKIQEEYSGKGLRVLALCKRAVKSESLPLGNQDAMEKFILDHIKELELVGMLALCDPPRAETLDTVKTIRAAGVRVFMVTGDFELTAMAIAKQVGILTAETSYTLDDLKTLKNEKPLASGLEKHQLRPKEEDTLMAITINGKELENMDESDWDYCAAKFSEMVFARTTPEQKLLIIENLKCRGDNVVAVTGDGTNDAPALKAADIGVAMGAGSDVAKEAAAMILLNNDFSSLLIGMENGRLVFENLKKVLMYLMPAGSYAEVMAVVANVFFGMQIPMSSFLQVVYCVINDVSMSISLMYETAESNLMKRPPRNARTDRLADWRFFVHVYFFLGVFVWVPCMGMFFYYMAEQGVYFQHIFLAFDKWTDGLTGKSQQQLDNYVSVGQSVYYVTVAICQFGTLLACRNRTVSIFESNFFAGPRKNLTILISMFTTIVVSAFVIYVPAIQNVFKTANIPLKFWFIPFGFAVMIVLMDEVRKALARAMPNSFISKMAW